MRIPCIALSFLLMLFLYVGDVNAQESASLSQETSISLFYLSNVTQMSPVDRGTRGGLARVSTVRKRINTPNALFLFGGDTLAPSVESNILKGQQMIAAWNAVGLDYAVPGEHEFDFGPAVLVDRMKESKFVWLSANVIDKKTGKPFGLLQPYAIRSLGGVNVGIFGLTLPGTPTVSKPGPDIDFLDPCETAGKVVREMRARNAQIIVALSHLSAQDNKKLARCMPQIDIIIGGHEEKPSESVVVQSVVGRIPVTQVDREARNLGWLYLSLQGTTVQSINWVNQPITSEYADDPVVARVIQDYISKLNSDSTKVIGSTKVALDVRPEVIRAQETNLGDFITDALRSAVNADVALLTGGSIRGTAIIPPGELTKRDIQTILPYDNLVLKLSLTGTDLRNALENGVSHIQDKSPRFPQVSGLSFIFDGRRPPGSRIISITVNGKPLEEKQTYTMATTKYLVEGGDDYFMLTKARVLTQGPKTDTEILIDAISSAGVIAPQTEGRIKRLDTR